MSYSISPVAFRIIGVLLLLVGLFIMFGSVMIGEGLFSIRAFIGLVVIIVGIFVLAIRKEKK